MTDKNVTVTSGNITFITLLQITFIVLKLCKVIDWKWVFVLMPLIIEGGLIIILLLFALIAFIIGLLTMSYKEAFKELKENAQEICEWELVRLNIIEKDLEVLETLKKKMSIGTDYYDSDDGCEKCEFITYNGEALNLDTEEFNKVKEWLENE